MFKLSRFIMIVVVVMLAPLCASASTVFDAPPFAWLGGAVDEVQMFIEPSGTTFATPGATGLTGTWSATDMNSQYVLMTGQENQPTFGVTAHFLTDGSSFSVNLYGSLGGTPLQTTYAVTYAVNSTGGDWNWSTSTFTPAILAAENTATPEPASFVLLGSGLLLAGIYRRRRKTS